MTTTFQEQIAAAEIGLMTVDANGRYRVNQDEIQRLKTLSQLRSKS